MGHKSKKPSERPERRSAFEDGRSRDLYKELNPPIQGPGRVIPNPTPAEITEHLDYLERVSTMGNPPPISVETAGSARRAWDSIWVASEGKMPVPAACTGPDGQMFYAWDRGRHHLELELIPGEPIEFFYRDRESNELWSEEYPIEGPLKAEIVSKLGLFY